MERKLNSNALQTNMEINFKTGSIKTDNNTVRVFDADGNMVFCRVVEGHHNYGEYDSNGNKLHTRNCGGAESWWEYESNDNMVHFKNSNGYEEWYDSDGMRISKNVFNELNS